MLVITRKIHENIILSHPALEKDILITLSKIRSEHQALIGITAPTSVNIRREEVPNAPRPPQQGEQAIPDTFYKADRERAHVGMNAFQLAYVEKLEKAVRAADLYEQAMRPSVHSPKQYAADMNLNIAMNKVNFLAEQDEPELEPGDLPRDVIFG